VPGLNIVDVGSGPPVVLVPGIQGRWEWMKPAVDALAARCRVVTFSLADEPTSGARFGPASGFDVYVDQLRDVLDARGLDRAAVCGTSFGGLIAAAFAARHPERVSALIFSSALPPSWRPNERQRMYVRSPWLFAPAFVVASLGLYREIAVAAGGLLQGLPLSARLLAYVSTHPTSPARMARRVERWMDAAAVNLSQVSAPTLVVTGEPRLELVVPVWMTHEYLKLCPQASTATIAGTGHLGLVTRPVEYAAVVGSFVERCAAQADARRRVG
jgi:(E)-2-((N-methylformamido)methylene)succinate hydrolase